MTVDSLFVQAINKITDYRELFSTVENNPERILIDIFSGESDNFLTRIIESSKELTGELIEVHDLQDYLYQLLIPYLNSLLKGLDVVYDSDNYPAPIQIFEGECEIGRLNIFERTFTVIPHEEIKREENQLLRLEEEFTNNAREIEQYERYQKTPLDYGDTVIKKAQITIRKKHYKKEILQKYGQLIELSMELEKDVIAQRLRVERVQEGLRPYEDMQYDIANLFRNQYGYEVRREETTF